MRLLDAGLTGLRGFADHPRVGEVRGCGLIAAVALVGDRQTKAPPGELGSLGRYLAGRAEGHGMITRPWAMQLPSARRRSAAPGRSA